MVAFLRTLLLLVLLAGTVCTQRLSTEPRSGCLPSSSSTDAVVAVVLLSDTKYWPGVLALHRSLDLYCGDACDHVPFLVLSTLHPKSTLSFAKSLAAWRDTRPCGFGNFSRLCVSIQTKYHPFALPQSTRSPYGTPSRFALTLDKLNVFDPCLYQELGVGVRRVVYLDADTFAQDECVSDLFDTGHFVEPAFANDILFPDSFNTGVMVIKPDYRFFSALWSDNQAMAMRFNNTDVVSNHSVRLAYDDELYSYDGGDQGVLNAAFGEMRVYNPSSKAVNYGQVYHDARHQLPFRYNAILFAAQLHEKEWDRMRRQTGVCVVHFSGRTPKPFSRVRDQNLIRLVQSSAVILHYYQRWHHLYAEVELDMPFKPTVAMDIY